MAPDFVLTLLKKWIDGGGRRRLLKSPRGKRWTDVVLRHSFGSARCRHLLSDVIPGRQLAPSDFAEGQSHHFFGRRPNWHGEWNWLLPSLPCPLLAGDTANTIKLIKDPQSSWIGSHQPEYSGVLVSYAHLKKPAHIVLLVRYLSNRTAPSERSRRISHTHRPPPGEKEEKDRSKEDIRSINLCFQRAKQRQWRWKAAHCRGGDGCGGPPAAAAAAGLTANVRFRHPREEAAEESCQTPRNSTAGH